MNGDETDKIGIQAWTLRQDTITRLVDAILADMNYRGWDRKRLAKESGASLWSVTGLLNGNSVISLPGRIKEGSVSSLWRCMAALDIKIEVVLSHKTLLK
jgi:hypothetical protein